MLLENASRKRRDAIVRQVSANSQEAKPNQVDIQMNQGAFVPKLCGRDPSQLVVRQIPATSAGSTNTSIQSREFRVVDEEAVGNRGDVVAGHVSSE